MNDSDSSAGSGPEHDRFRPRSDRERPGTIEEADRIIEEAEKALEIADIAVKRAFDELAEKEKLQEAKELLQYSSDQLKIARTRRDDATDAPQDKCPDLIQESMDAALNSVESAEKVILILKGD